MQHEVGVVEGMVGARIGVELARRRLPHDPADPLDRGPVDERVGLAEVVQARRLDHREYVHQPRQRRPVVTHQRIDRSLHRNVVGQPAAEAEPDEDHARATDFGPRAQPFERGNHVTHRCGPVEAADQPDALLEHPRTVRHRFGPEPPEHLGRQHDIAERGQIGGPTMNVGRQPEDLLNQDHPRPGPALRHPEVCRQLTISDGDQHAFAHGRSVCRPRNSGARHTSSAAHSLG